MIMLNYTFSQKKSHQIGGIEFINLLRLLFQQECNRNLQNL